MSDVYGEVVNERERQEAKWGQQDHHPACWLVILTEETGEACKAVLERDLLQYRAELVQVAAVAVAGIEALDRALKGQAVMADVEAGRQRKGVAHGTTGKV